MTKSAIVLAAMLASVTMLPAEGMAKNGPGHCPPGLAKKSLPCVPPGQARQGFAVGDQLPGGYYVVRDPSRYRLPRLAPGESYYRVGDTFFRVDRDTREILQLIEAVGAVLN
jgi:hypothetical protein